MTLYVLLLGIAMLCILPFKGLNLVESMHMRHRHTKGVIWCALGPIHAPLQPPRTEFMCESRVVGAWRGGKSSKWLKTFVFDQKAHHGHHIYPPTPGHRIAMGRYAPNAPPPPGILVSNAHRTLEPRRKCHFYAFWQYPITTRVSQI